MKIIDVHAHIDCSSQQAAKKTLSDYCRIMEKVGIHCALLMPRGTHRLAQHLFHVKP